MHACTHACMSSHKHTHTYEHTHTHLNSSTQQQTHEEGTEEEVETKKMKTKVRDTEADRHITPLYEFTHTPEEEPDEHHEGTQEEAKSVVLADARYHPPCVYKLSKEEAFFTVIVYLPYMRIRVCVCVCVDRHTEIERERGRGRERERERVRERESTNNRMTRYFRQILGRFMCCTLPPAGHYVLSVCTGI